MRFAFFQFTPRIKLTIHTQKLFQTQKGVAHSKVPNVIQRAAPADAKMCNPLEVLMEMLMSLTASQLLLLHT